MMRRALVLLVAAGCHPAPSAPSATPAPAPEASPGAVCLAEASAPREARPDEPSAITVAHVLVKHRGAERAPADVTRSREEACLRALEALEALKGGASFDAVVAEYSDEDGAATRGGMIGEVRREDVAPTFADAAFRLDIGQMSHVVESPFGFHLILRTR